MTDSLLWVPDLLIRATRASDDSRQECEDLASEMRARGFEPLVELPSEKSIRFGSVDLFVHVMDSAPDRAVDELITLLMRRGWKKVLREVEERPKQGEPEEGPAHQSAHTSSAGIASRVVMIKVGDAETLMERSER